ncbi:MAG: hypothetical protein V4702_06425 [Patescibacteria group bacterium]
MGYRVGSYEVSLTPLKRIIAAGAVVGGLALFGAQAEGSPQVDHTASAQNSTTESPTVTTTTGRPPEDSGWDLSGAEIATGLVVAIGSGFALGRTFRAK